MRQEIYTKIGRNSFYNILRRVLLLPLNLILIPIILRYIGVERYGIWVFIQTIMTFATLMDFGISSGITKFTAEYEAGKNHLKILQVFNTLFIVYLFICIWFFIAIFVCQDWIINTFIRTEQIVKADISFILLSSAAIFGMNIAFSVYPSFLDGLQRMDLTNKARILWGICNFLFSAVFLSIGWGIKGLVIANGLSSLITLFVYILFSAKVAPYLRLNPLLFDFATLVRVFRFSSYGAFGGILAMLHFQFDKLIISYFLGLKYLAFYDVAQRIVFLLWGVSGSFTTAVMPAASSMYASFGTEKLKELFETTFKYMALIAIPIFLFTSVFASQIVSVWLGTGYEQSAFVLRFLSVVYLISTLTGPGASILTGMGLPKIPFYAVVMAAFINTSLSLLLVVRFGLAGIIISALSAYILSGSYGFYCFQKKLSVPGWDMMNCLKFPLLTSISILLILSFIAKDIKNYLIQLVTAAILFPVIYILLIYKNPDYNRIRQLIRQPVSVLSFLRTDVEGH